MRDQERKARAIADKYEIGPHEAGDSLYFQAQEVERLAGKPTNGFGRFWVPERCEDLKKLGYAAENPRGLVDGVVKCLSAENPSLKKNLPEDVLWWWAYRMVGAVETAQDNKELLVGLKMVADALGITGPRKTAGELIGEMKKFPAVSFKRAQ